MASAEGPSPVADGGSRGAAADTARAAVRIVGSSMLGVSVVCMLSGGIGLLSSVFVLVQASYWLRASASPESLSRAASKIPPRVCCTASCCCCSRSFADIHGLAIAGIVFACLESVMGIAVGLGYGYILLTPQCAVCTTWSPGCTCDYVSSFDAYIAGWLLYTAGNAVVVGPLNITWCVTSLHFLRLLRGMYSPAPPAARLGALADFPPVAIDKAAITPSDGAQSRHCNLVCAATGNEVELTGARSVVVNPLNFASSSSSEPTVNPWRSTSGLSLAEWPAPRALSSVVASDIGTAPQAWPQDDAPETIVSTGPI